MSTFYATLEVGEQATPEEIRRAYRRLVLLTHPDLFRMESVRMGLVGDHLAPTADGRPLQVVVDLDADAVADAFVDVLQRYRP